MKVLIVISAIVLVGCEHNPSRLDGTGVPVDPPFGFVKLCAEHPEFAGCPK